LCIELRWSIMSSYLSRAVQIYDISYTHL